MPKIIHNGQEYDDVNQMPPEVREAYERAMKAMGNIFADNDKNGVPDVFENTTGNPNVVTTYHVEVNGKAYNNPQELPAKLRPLFEQLAKQSDNDIQDWVKEPDEPTVAVTENPPEWIKQQSAVQYNSEPVIQTVNGKPSQIIILLISGVILVVAIVIAALVLLQ